eukprot:SAG11_NODE_8162_length_1053_cov_2.102725_2_plen_100_part_01
MSVLSSFPATEITRIPAFAMVFKAVRDAASDDFRWAKYCLDEMLFGELSKLARAFAVFMSERDFLLHGCGPAVPASVADVVCGLDLAFWSRAYCDALVHL